MEMCGACKRIDSKRRSALGHFDLVPIGSTHRLWDGAGASNDKQFQCLVCDTKWTRVAAKDGTFAGWKLAE